MAIQFNQIAKDTALTKENIDAFEKELSSFESMKEDEKKYYYAKGIYFAAHLPLSEEVGGKKEGVDVLNHILHQTGSRQAALSLMRTLIGIGVLEVADIKEQNGIPVKGQEVYLYVEPSQLDAVNDARRKITYINPVSPDDALKEE